MNSLKSFFGSSTPSEPLPKASETKEMFMRNAELTFPKECDKRIRKSIKEGRNFADCDRLSYPHTQYIQSLGYRVTDQVHLPTRKAESHISWLSA